jgi:lipid A 1-phosphatase
MASCAAYFVARRYGLWHALYLIPIMLLTMSARVMLDAHTISAVLTGCLIGLICAAWWTSPYQPRTPIGESK